MREDPASAMIEFSGVSKRYGGSIRGIPALSDVSFRIDAGTVIAVVGPNGAGKSTLLGLLLGFLRPTTGNVTIDGHAPRDWVRRNGAGYLPERFSPPGEWRVDGMLRAFAGLDGHTPADAVASAGNARHRFGLDASASREIRTLSRGLLQRLGLAQTTLAKRRIVVFDEPTEGLDPHGRILFRETVAAMRTDGTTIIIASHDLAELERMSDRALVLDGGKLREVVTLRSTGGHQSWLLLVQRAVASMDDYFPGAERVVRDDSHGQDEARYRVMALDARDLTTRLAALIAAGVTIIEVKPDVTSLEQRLKDAGGS